MWQVIFSKTYQRMSTRKVGQDASEIYDNDLGDGIVYSGTPQLPQSVEEMINDRMNAYESASTQLEKAQAKKQVNWVIAGATAAQAIIQNGKKITSQYDGEDVLGRSYSTGDEIYWLRNTGTVIAE